MWFIKYYHAKKAKYLSLYKRRIENKRLDGFNIAHTIMSTCNLIRDWLLYFLKK